MKSSNQDKLRKELMRKVAFLDGMISGDVTEGSARSEFERQLYLKFLPLSREEKRSMVKSMVQEVHKLGY